MIDSYINQLKELAMETGWNLQEACKDSGIADTTYYRWINKTTCPRLKQVRIVAEYMLKYRH